MREPAATVRRPAASMAVGRAGLLLGADQREEQPGDFLEMRRRGFLYS